MSKYHQVTLLLLGVFLVGTPLLAEEDVQDPRRDRRHAQRPSFEDRDQNGDGKLSFEEFAAVHMQRLNQRFRQIDRDGDGALSQDEIREAHKQRRPRGPRRHGEGSRSEDCSRGDKPPEQ